MKSALMVCALGVLVLPALANAAPAQTYPDHLSPAPSGDVMKLLDGKSLAVARQSELVAQVTRAFTGGYVVGVSKRADGAWQLIGEGNEENRWFMLGPSMSPKSCARPIDATLAARTKALWAKMLGEATSDNGWMGLDGAFYNFYLRGAPRDGAVWSPDEHRHPRLTRLVRLADQMFAVCLRGRGVDELNRQLNSLLH